MTDLKPDNCVMTSAILESISDGVFTVGQDWRITSFNRAAEEITGIPRKEAIGRLCSEVFKSSMCEAECALRNTLKNGRPIINKSGYIINAEGARIPVSVSTAVLRSPDGTVFGGAETFRDLSEVVALRRELEGRFSAGDLVSHSPAMRPVVEMAAAVADSPSTVLILGETGTGKEVLAKAIHSMSSRAGRPFVAVNCGALPDSLLESELFGYRKGAFTGADRDKPGRFALAEDGTLFLDEIGEISQALQVSLLRVLQEQVYEPLGSTRSEKSRARIIVATNRDLAAMVKKGEFRQDLYYRINVIAIQIPPLRKRKEDIPLLTEYFIERFNRIHNKSIKGVTPAANSLLLAHDWPGNIRELENVIERAFVLCSSRLIGQEHLPPELTGFSPLPSGNAGMGTLVRCTEEQAILAALKKHGYNRAAAARELGIHKTTLFRKIRSLGIELPEQDGRSSVASV
ncbi:MAG TPA: sigma 54-interacting transcriptional regulator [Deltaproteobacteria bacterium]|nr:sigma 54-interacting transcriptional regulator [Deltaproteobacteria bacterium]HQB38715.1 sigma 54-interacting transcriptional regulator [Deltaproteobacteria bacterium]